MLCEFILHLANKHLSLNNLLWVQTQEVSKASRMGDIRKFKIITSKFKTQLKKDKYIELFIKENTNINSSLKAKHLNFDIEMVLNKSFNTDVMKEEYFVVESYN